MKLFFAIGLMMLVSAGCLFAQNQNLTVQSLVGTNVDAILQQYLMGEGVSITNGTFNNTSGNVVSNQIGVFNRNNFTQFPFETGLIMTTGNVMVAQGPNTSSSLSSITGVVDYTESALQSLESHGVFNCATLDFDFQTQSDSFAFRYVFASEEYCEYVNSEFNDIFAFFLTGPDPVTQVQVTRNVAIIPGSVSASNPDGIPVSINSVNHGYHDENSQGPGSNPSNSQYFVHNSAQTGIQYDGYTVALTAGSPILACQPYHMKLAVGNVGDNGFDSGVFLEANSFESAADPTLSMSGVYCLHDSIVFNFVAQNVDSIHLVTPSGDTLWNPPFVIPDALESDTGYYYLRAKKGVSCNGDMWSRDSIHLEIRIPCVSELCNGAEFCAGDEVSYPYAYDSIVGPWVNYVSNNQFTISPPASLAADTTVYYHLSMYDEYGCYFDTIVSVNVHIPYHFDIDLSACDSFVWHGQTYTQSGVYEHTMQTGFSCDSLYTLHLTLHNSVASTDSLQLTQNQLPYYFPPADTTFAVGSPSFFQFVYTLSTQYGCDSVITMQVTVLENHLYEFDTVLCESELPFTWNGHTFTSAGTWQDTLLAANGSDSVVVMHLATLPTYESFFEGEICEGDGYAQHGFVVSGDETVGLDTLERTLILQTEDGCDSILHLRLLLVDTTLRIVSMTEDFCDAMLEELMVITSIPNYVWSTGETSPNITVTLPGVYVVTASQGNCRITAHYVVSGCEVALYLPNAITPSRSDGLNDAFGIPEQVQSFLYDFEITIFDRWGSMVYYSTDKSFRWNGEVDGKLAVNSVFNYIIHYKNINGKPFVVKGTLIVL